MGMRLIMPRSQVEGVVALLVSEIITEKEMKASN
jgi:hypothetical protein